MLTQIQKRVLKYVAEILNKNKIPFQISGGLAAMIYGSKRPLNDIDIDVCRNDIKKVENLFREYLIEPFFHLRDKNFDIWIMTFDIDGIRVDVTQAEKTYFVGKEGKKIRMDAHPENAKIMNIEGINVPVENKEDLIAYKKIINRKVDLIDIKQIEES
jgi:predicted nucleotidyltransferase